jgi:hypothetical protein
MQSHESNLARLHYQMVRGLIDEGACPSNPELARCIGVPQSALENLLRDLAGIHGVVTHSRLTPTLNWIQGRQRGWWANATRFPILSHAELFVGQDSSPAADVHVGLFVLGYG